MKKSSISAKKRRLIVQVAILFLCSVLILLLISNFLYKTEYNASLREIRAQQKNEVSQQQHLFHFTFETIASDLKVLTGHNDFKLLINKPALNIKQHRLALSDELMHFISHKQKYDQVRFIDMRGQEIIRISNINGKAQSTPVELLQNKAERYYFKSTAKLKANEIFISPLDLNIEKGEIETPLKPTIRFGLPIYNSEANKGGILIINYLANYLLNNLTLNADEKNNSLLLVNTDGYWLKGLHPENEWGFMYEEKNTEVMAKSFPDAWKKISTNETGQFINEQGMFTYNTVHPLINTSGLSPEVRNYQVSQKDYAWKIISFHPAKKLFSHTNETLNRFILLNMVLILIIAFSLWFYTRLKLINMDTNLIFEEKDALVHNIVNTAFDGIVTINGKGIITSFNASALAMFGYEIDEVMGRNIDIIVPSPHHEQHDAYLSRYLKTQDPHIIGKPRELDALHKNGKTFPIELCVSGKKVGSEWMFIGTIRDIHERKELQKDLEKMATTDGLTQLHNRAFFTKQLDYEFNRAKRYKLDLALAFLDIDFFKSVNDSHGHLAGDAMLIAIAKSLKEASRDIDFVTRYGGEEFAIILPETDKKSALIYAERLRQKIAETEVVYESKYLNRTASIGVAAIKTSHIESADQFIKKADDALYQAKGSGRNKVVFWDADFPS